MNLLRHVCHPQVVQFIGAYMNPVQVHGAGGKNAPLHSPCIVTEYLSHGSLYKVLRNKEEFELTPRDKLHVVENIAKGMAYLHSFDPPLIHRDLKSPNILIGENFEVKVCDFGMARFLETSRTMTDRLGTMIWMAPELFCRRDYDERVDVYSFAIIMWEVWTRQLPYNEIPDLRQIEFHVSQGHRPAVPKDCPAPWATLMTSCWDQEPSRRPTFQNIVTFFAKYRSEIMRCLVEDPNDADDEDDA